MSNRFEIINRASVDLDAPWGVLDWELYKVAPFAAEEDARSGLSQMLIDAPEELATWHWVAYGDDNVDHPSHYLAGGLEAIDVLDAFAPDNPTVWNALKYVLRHEKKGGTEDLKKAVWYLQREITKREAADG